MKTYILISILSTLCWFKTYSQFTLVPTNTKQDLFELTVKSGDIMVNALKNYAVKSNNDCNTLIPLTIPSSTNYINFHSMPEVNSVYMLSVNESSWNSYIYKSIDGGFNWIPKYTTNNLATNLVFYDSLEGIFFNGLYQLYRTKNGGNSWVTGNSPLSLIDAVAVFGDSTICIGGIVSTNRAFYLSKDRGNTWKPQGTFANPSSVAGISFVSKDSIFINSTNTDYGPYLAKTLNGGTNWQFIKILPGNDFELRGNYFKNVLEGYIVGKLNADSTGIILKTIDGGQNWKVNLTPYKSLFHNIKPLNDSTFLISGSNGVLLKMNYKNAVFTGIGEFKDNLSNLIVWPNPVHFKLQLKTEEFKKEDLKATIRNSIGQTVLSVSLNNNNSEIDVSNLTSGLYFLTLRGQKAQKTIKFIKE